MKDRIIFFVLGAILATIAYFVGDMRNVSAQNETAFFDNVEVLGHLSVRGSIVVQHHLPDNKINLVIIEATEHGPRITQQYMTDRDKMAEGKMSERASIWEVRNEGTTLRLIGTDHFGGPIGVTAIMLENSNAVKAIVPALKDDIISVK
ncbi:MAG: hypothetical protein OXN27_07035 [Candidatus Poribacteria bacterium]|nr:hypothetical protein [Candidatus Poribacteria bacterium]